MDRVADDFRARIASRYGEPLEPQIRRGARPVAREQEITQLRQSRRVSNLNPDLRSAISGIIRRESAARRRNFSTTPAAAPQQPPRAVPSELPPPPAAPTEPSALPAEPRSAPRDTPVRAPSTDGAAAALRTELQEMERRRRVAELLNSTFRANLEELITLHYELVTSGLAPTAGTGAPAAHPPADERRSRYAEPEPPAPTADMRALEARLDSMAAEMRELGSQSRQMGQLLASGFSLSLSLHEQLARTTTALCSLADRLGPDAAAHTAKGAPPAPAASAPLAPPPVAPPPPRPPPTHATKGSSRPSPSMVESLLLEMVQQQAELMREVHALGRRRLADSHRIRRRRTRRGVSPRTADTSDTSISGDESMEADSAPSPSPATTPASFAAAAFAASSSLSSYAAFGQCNGSQPIGGDHACAPAAEQAPSGLPPRLPRPHAHRAPGQRAGRGLHHLSSVGQAAAPAHRSRRAQPLMRSTVESVAEAAADLARAHATLDELTMAAGGGDASGPPRGMADGDVVPVAHPPTSAMVTRPASQTCILCLENDADAVLYRCGHRCACLRCAHFLRYEKKPCPLCRAPIDDVIRVYECT